MKVEELLSAPAWRLHWHFTEKLKMVRKLRNCIWNDGDHIIKQFIQTEEADCFFCWVKIKQFLPVASALLIGGVTVTSFTIHQGKGFEFIWHYMIKFWLICLCVCVCVLGYINSGKKHAAVSGVSIVGWSDCRSCGNDQSQWKAIVFKASSLPSHLINIIWDSLCLTFFPKPTPTVPLFNVRTKKIELKVHSTELLNTMQLVVL